MAAKIPLQGLELVDCARANAKQGIKTACNLCGYGDDFHRFMAEVQNACDTMGVKFTELSDLITEQDGLIRSQGEIVAPDTENIL